MHNISLQSSPTTNQQSTLGNLVKIKLKITENHWNSQFTEILEKRFYWNLSGLLKETEILILLTAY